MSKRTAYFFVDEDGTENVSNIKPIRNVNEGFWEVPCVVNGEQSDAIVELPRGTLEVLFVRQYTWADEPIVLKENR